MNAPREQARDAWSVVSKELLSSQVIDLFQDEAGVLSKIIQDDPDGRAAKLIRRRLKEWSKRGEAANSEAEALSPADGMKRRIAYMERLSEDFKSLIEEIKTLSAKKRVRK